MASWGGLFLRILTSREGVLAVARCLTQTTTADAEKPIGGREFTCRGTTEAKTRKPWTSDAHWLSTIPVLKRSSFLPRNPTATKMMETDGPSRSLLESSGKQNRSRRRWTRWRLPLQTRCKRQTISVPDGIMVLDEDRVV